VALCTGGLGVTASAAGAQSVLERTPNLPGGWVGRPGLVHFNVLHRFTGSEEGTPNATDTPTFFLGYGLRGYGLLGLKYATGTTIVPDESGEWEALVRLSPFTTTLGAAFDLGLTAAYNEAAESFDSELALGVPLGPVALSGAARFFTDGWGSGDARWAVGAGARLRLHEQVRLAGDVVTPVDTRNGEAFGWGAALQLGIPQTAHSLSIQATNTSSSTLQGSSREAGGTRWGFEFTVPFQPFGGPRGATAPENQRLGEADVVGADTVRITLGDGGPDPARQVVRPGTHVIWSVEGELPHSTTAVDRRWDSRIMAPGESYGRVFTDPGEYPYRCTLHPGEEGVIVVEAPGG
jgi:plastocyanin